MDVLFRTKEESNAAQEAEFLALSPAERVRAFLTMVHRMKDFPAKHQNKPNNNFVIEIDMNRAEK